MVKLNVTPGDDKTYRRALKEASSRGEDMTPLMLSLGAGFEASIRERFAETSRAPDGTNWRPSIEAMIEGRRTLLKSGNLADSITSVADASSVEVGTNVFYAAVHQRGAKIRAKTARGLFFTIGGELWRKMEVTIPARPFVGVSPEDEMMIITEATDWIAGAFTDGGIQ